MLQVDSGATDYWSTDNWSSRLELKMKNFDIVYKRLLQLTEGSVYHTRKLGKSEYYWENLYSALCNNWILIDDNDLPVLLSFRYTAELVSQLVNADYYDFYLCGMGADKKDKKDIVEGRKKGLVELGIVTNQIREDLLCIGVQLTHYDDE